MRAQAGAAERARVARELHDGVIQALFGLDMKLEALRRGGDQTSATIAAELAGMQQMVRGEILELRDLMNALRPIELDNSRQLPGVLASMVERFQRDTGISARFVVAGDLPVVLPATALELVRIAQEALVNVRKHSGAKNVLVRLSGSPQQCALVVEDDGCGLEFDGRLTDDELERRHTGPVIIRERARVAGARLAIDSAPGEGTRVELTVSEAGRA